MTVDNLALTLDSSSAIDESILQKARLLGLAIGQANKRLNASTPNRLEKK